MSKRNVHKLKVWLKEANEERIKKLKDKYPISFEKAEKQLKKKSK